ncbi:serine dehydratase subunit alpha family protein [Candidatus Bathyarchaeota archaeon]|nr:serine dehydratase subunit alpha family protein [Candidatus Bathyarchaeota archaeon]
MNLREFFDNEVKPALGCTEPGAVAYAAATAAKHLGNDVKRISLELSGSIYKNGVSVGVPGTNGGTGNLLAAALGAAVGDPEIGLQSLAAITEDDVAKAQEMVDGGQVTQEVLPDTPGVYVKVILSSGDEEASATISGRHDNVVEATHNGETVYRRREKKGEKEENGYVEELIGQDMEGLWALASGISTEIEAMMLEGARMNKTVAENGLKEPWGLGVGFHINQMAPEGDLLYMTKAYAGAAADARMGGGPWPIMSSAGSGNHGITAILPPTLYAEANGNTDRELAEALALSHLITRYIKAYTGILSPICGCAIAAGAGASAAIVKLAGGTPKQAETAVANQVASVMGMTCDGGKGSCALKVSTAAGEAYLYAALALSGGGITGTQGLLKPDLRSVAEVLGELSDRCLQGMDKVILDIMQRL